MSSILLKAQEAPPPIADAVESAPQPARSYNRRLKTWLGGGGGGGETHSLIQGWRLTRINADIYRSSSQAKDDSFRETKRKFRGETTVPAQDNMRKLVDYFSF